jgi:hypothetical protein
MDAASCTETLVTIIQILLREIAEDGNLKNIIKYSIIARHSSTNSN